MTPFPNVYTNLALVAVGLVGMTFAPDGDPGERPEVVISDDEPVPAGEPPDPAFCTCDDMGKECGEWLTACGVPTSEYWTRKGIETLMFFRDPSGNVIELFCDGGYEGAADLARGPARGHGITIDIDALRYTDWHLPADLG